MGVPPQNTNSPCFTTWLIGQYVTQPLLSVLPCTWPHHSIMVRTCGRPYIVAMVYTGEQPPVKFQPAGPDAPECFFISLDQCQYFKLESYCAPLHLGSWFFFFPSNNSLHSRLLTPAEQKILSQY